MVTTSTSNVKTTDVVTYEYSSPDKVSKMSYASGWRVDITWNTDNITQMKGYSGANLNSTNSTATFDTKPHPYYPFKDFIELSHNTVIGKNIAMNNSITDINGTTTNYQFTINMILVGGLL